MPINVQKAKLQAIINGLGDELGGFAKGQVDAALSTDAARADQLYAAFRAGIGEDFMTAMLNEAQHEKRAALIRLASKAMALLALDEAVRGESEIEREAAQTDELGSFRRRTG